MPKAQLAEGGVSPIWGRGHSGTSMVLNEFHLDLIGHGFGAVESGRVQTGLSLLFGLHIMRTVMSL